LADIREHKLFSSILNRVYGVGAYQPQAIWHEYTLAARRWINIGEASIVVVNTSVPQHQITETISLTEVEHIRHLELMHTDSRWASGIEKLHVGRVYRDKRLYSNDNLPSTRFHREYFKKKHSFHAAGGLFHKDNDCQILIKIYQDPEQGEIPKDKIDKLQLLMPHLQKAYQMNQALLQVEQADHCLREGLARIGTGIVHLDLDGTILRMNSVADQYLIEGVFSIIKNSLVLSDYDADIQLRAHLSDHTSPDNSKQTSFLIKWKPSLSPLLGTLIHSRPKWQDLSATYPSSHVLLIQNPKRKKQYSPALLQCLWGLTYAEARLASALADGNTLRACSDMFGVTYETARSQLKMIFQKSDLHCQNELVSVVNSFGH
jgi:DNA-binding CsgD family transcriptional regulator